MVKIREQVNQEGGSLGIAAVDVRIRRADLPRQISEKVFSRMQSERAREAAEYRAKGSETAQTLKSDSRSRRRRAPWQRATRSRPDPGRGRCRTKPHFRRRPMARIPISLPSIARCKPMKPGSRAADTRMVVSPKSDFFRFFGSPNGQPGAHRLLRRAADRLKAAAGPQADEAG